MVKRVVHSDYKTVKSKHEPIVSKDVWDKANAMHESKTRNSTSKELRFVYAGILKCGVCGRAMVLQIHTGRNLPYRVTCSNKKYCSNVSLRYDKLHALILCALKEKLKDFEVQTNISNKKMLKAFLNRFLCVMKRWMIS